MRTWTWMSLGLVLALTGCDGGGGGGGGGDAGRDSGNSGASQLVGSWAYENCGGLEGTNCIYQFEFAASGSYTHRSYYVKSSETTTGFAGCTINIEASGYRWTATATTLSIELGDNPTSLITYTDCDDPADNQLTPVPTPDFVPASYTSGGPQPYRIEGDQLTIGEPGGLVITLTRQ